MNDAVSCDYHHRTPATARCGQCDRPVCDVCRRVVNARDHCTGCAVGRETQLPWLAAVFGLLLPGAGQAYNGEVGKGVLVLLTSPLVVPWVWGVVDAARVATAIAEGRRDARTVPTGGVLLALKILWFPLAAVFGTMVAALAALLAGALAAAAG